MRIQGYHTYDERTGELVELVGTATVYRVGGAPWIASTD